MSVVSDSDVSQMRRTECGRGSRSITAENLRLDYKDQGEHTEGSEKITQGQIS